MPDGEHLVKLTQLHGIRPQRLRQTAKSVYDHAINLETMFLQPSDALYVGSDCFVRDIFAPDNLFSEVIKDAFRNNILWYKFVRHESVADYVEGVGWLREGFSTV